MTSSVHLLSRGRVFFYFLQYVWDVGYVVICPVIPFSGGRFSPCHRSFVMAHKT